MRTEKRHGFIFIIYKKNDILIQSIDTYNRRCSLSESYLKI